MRTLLFDLGNTSIKWRLDDSDTGQTEGGFILNSHFLNQSARVPDIWRTAGRVLAASVSGENIKSELVRSLENLGLFIHYWAVSGERACGVTSAYRDAGSLGVDRWLAMVGARSLTGDSFCVVDCGSAITLDVVDRQGVHLGGFIMPGVQLLRESLRRSTARLSGHYSFDRSPLPGKSTGECISRGISLLLSGIDHWLLQWLDGSSEEEKRRVFLTGGDATDIGALLSCNCDVRPGLVLDGLLIQAEKDSGVD